MRRGRTILLLILIVVIVIAVAAVVISRLGSTSGGPEVAPTAEMVQIIQIGQPVRQGDPITPDVLTPMTIPLDQFNEVMYRYTQQDEVINMLARYPLEPGLPLTSAMLAVDAADLAVSAPQWIRLIPPGMTAIALPATRLSTGAYAVRDGSHVNIIACLMIVDVDPTYQAVLPNTVSQVMGTGYAGQNSLPALTTSVTPGGPQGRVELDGVLQQPFYITQSETQRARLVCQLLMQDVVVMRLGTFPENTETVAAASADTADQAAPETVNTEPRPDIITLIVNPQDSVTLNYLMWAGAKFTLTLRGSGDNSRVATEAATLQYVLSQYGIPIPAKLPYAIEPRVDALLDPSLPNDLISTQQ